MGEATSVLLFQGDTIEYQWENGELSASPNVEIHYKDYTIKAEAMEIRTTDSIVYFPKTFKIEQDRYHVTAHQGRYHFKKFEGDAHDLNAHIERTWITGKKLVIHPVAIEIQDATFTTCYDRNPLHYQLKSSSIMIYPQVGFFVAFNNVLFLNAIPILPIPTYIYGSTRYSLLGYNAPLPEVGSNILEGGYVKQAFNYFLHQDSSGSVEVGLTEKLGALFGLSHGISFSPFYQLKFNARYTKEFGFSGGTTFFINLIPIGPEEARPQFPFLDSFIPLFSPETPPLSRIVISYRFRELINDYWVDKKPLITLEINKFHIKEWSSQLSSKANFGLLAEENLSRRYFQSWRSYFESQLSRSYALTSDLTLELSTSFNGYWYDTGQTWQRVFGESALIWKSSLFSNKLSYTKRFFTTGKSLFDFDSLYLKDNDELGMTFSLGNSSVQFTTEAAYILDDIPSDRLRILDFIGKIDFHCWRLFLRWKTKQSQVNLGVELY